MEEKWKHQAQYGTEIHNVLQQFFTKTSKGKYWYELLADPHSGAMHKANFIANLRARPQKGEPKITNITTDKIIEDILTYAEDLRD
jgi:hypothetical protein